MKLQFSHSTNIMLYKFKNNANWIFTPKTCLPMQIMLLENSTENVRGTIRSDNSMCRQTGAEASVLCHAVLHKVTSLFWTET